jgi:hypothetical protein
MAKLSYEELCEAYRRLMTHAFIINDHLQIDVDHAIYTGSMNQVEDFREFINDERWRLHEVLYGDDNPLDEDFIDEDHGRD